MIRTAKATRYAPTTSSMAPSDAARPVRMAGVATFAIVVSTWDRNGAITSTASGLALGFVEAGFESVPDTLLLTFAMGFRHRTPAGRGRLRPSRGAQAPRGVTQFRWSS